MGDAVDTTTFHVIGDICLVKFRDELTLPRKREEARRIQILVHVKTVCELQGIEGELRTPIVRKLLGGETVTVHKEHGVLYKLDVAKIMFSKGNVNERQRLTGLVQRNERILDMFAGIGYFTLPLAKTALPREIVACEKNLVAYHYLKENIVLNKVGGVIPLRRDCRTLTYHHAFDRILMGYFPGTETFLPHALRMTTVACFVSGHEFRLFTTLQPEFQRFGHRRTPWEAEAMAHGLHLLKRLLR